MRRIFILTFLPILFLNGCVDKKESQDSPNTSNFSSETYGLISYEYEDLGEKLIFWDDVPNIGLVHYYVYFFSRTCGHCQRIKDLVIPNLLKRKIYFACESSREHVFCSITPKGNFGEIDFCIPGYPTIIEIKNWAIVKSVSGENEVLSFLNTK